MLLKRERINFDTLPLIILVHFRRNGIFAGVTKRKEGKSPIKNKKTGLTNPATYGKIELHTAGVCDFVPTSPAMALYHRAHESVKIQDVLCDNRALCIT